MAGKINRTRGGEGERKGEGEEDQDEFQSHSMVGFPRDEMRPRPPLPLPLSLIRLVQQFSSPPIEISLLKAKPHHRHPCQQLPSKFARRMRPNDEMGMGTFTAYCELTTERARSRMHLRRRRRETATDALKADFMTFRRRVHFVCRGGRDPRRQSLERGIRVGDGMPDDEASAKNWRSLVPHSFRRPCVFCETANPSLPS